MKSIIFIHGYLSTGKGFKGKFLKKIFPEILTPNFKGSLNKRMEKLKLILEKGDTWIIIGSSYGGLMGSLYAIEYPKKVEKLILLAPYLTSKVIDPINFNNIPINIPVIAYHGTKDNTVDFNQARSIALKLFSNLSYNSVDDDHGLDKTMYKINWKDLVMNN